MWSGAQTTDGQWAVFGTWDGDRDGEVERVAKEGGTDKKASIHIISRCTQLR